jgi:hypothetical protein
MQIESWWLKVVDAAECGVLNERLLEAHRQLTDLFECPAHGSGCIPYAVEEVCRLRNRAGRPTLPHTDLLVLKPVANEDHEHLTCIICGRGESESRDAPEWLVTMRAPDATLCKGLHEECWRLTERYLGAKGVAPDPNHDGTLIASSHVPENEALRDRVHYLETELKRLVRIWEESDLIGPDGKLNSAMARIRRELDGPKETHD